MGVYKCPVCEGRGFVHNGFYQTLQDYYTSSSTATEMCRSCGGKGIVYDAELFQHACYNNQHQDDPNYTTSFIARGTCSNCEHNDRMVYTSNPVKYKCTLNNDWHEADYRCEHWAEQQQKLVQGVYVDNLSDYITLTGLNSTGTENSKISNITKSNKCAGCTYDGECDSFECKSCSCGSDSECHKGNGCANYDNFASLG